jgi:hypothetical protein
MEGVRGIQPIRDGGHGACLTFWGSQEEPSKVSPSGQNRPNSKRKQVRVKKKKRYKNSRRRLYGGREVEETRNRVK